MTYSRDQSTHIGEVLQALSNGLRSDVEIANATRLALDRVHIALTLLVVDGCVVESAGARFRLTDTGADMVKEGNGAGANVEAVQARRLRHYVKSI
jgi:predicted transcriptional regulator